MRARPPAMNWSARSPAPFRDWRLSSELENGVTQASAFASFSEADWRASASAALGGAKLETLMSRAADGVELQPIYRRREGPRALSGESGWRRLARLDHPDAAAANDQALDDLANGADGLQVVFAGGAGAYGFGLAAYDVVSLSRAFEGLRFDSAIRFELDLGPDGAGQAQAFAALAAGGGVDLAKVDIVFGLDPIGALARSGCATRPWDAEAVALANVVSALQRQGFVGPFVAADARLVHAAGGSPAQELGFALAAALAYLRALTENGFSLVSAAAAISFRLTADSDQLFTLAKFRALRLLWGRVREACGLDAAPARIHAETDWRSLSARDPYVNAMRGASAAFSAGLGGADSVAVLPFTQCFGLPDAAARRLARNSQSIMIEEAHLGFVADPAAGAGVFEALTEALCEKAWAAMQELERAGGLASALREGGFQLAVAAERARLVENAARRESLESGRGADADLTESSVTTLPAAPPAFPFAGDRVAEPLRPIRIAEPFERLRAASDAADLGASIGIGR
ncbi:MAG: methylmalonyl-CoA mutase [Bradyrhizobium sp.]|nr:MAG: methylmalonyl-CoA mutase [Bradyrhizobium sp.]